MNSRLLSFLFIITFGMFALASPLVETRATDMVARGGDSQLTAILNIFLDLQVNIKVVITALLALPHTADCATLVAELVVLIQACITAVIDVGVVVQLDAVIVAQIAAVVAEILVSINACVTVFASILVNVVAVVNLDICLQTLLIHLNLCVSGILVIIAPLAVNITVVVNLALSLVITLLAL